LVWDSKPSLRAQHDGDGIEAFWEASKRRTRGGIAWLASAGRGVRQRRGRPMARTHKHYLNAPVKDRYSEPERGGVNGSR
jgi:hypothetical protein